MEDAFKVGGRTCEVHQHEIGVRGCDRQPLRLRERYHRGVVRLGRPELFCERIRSQVVAVVGAGGVVDLLEQVGQPCRVAQRQAKRGMEAVGGRKAAHFLHGSGCRREAVPQHLPVGRPGGCCGNGREQEDKG